MAQMALCIYDGSVWTNPDGNRNVPYLDQNGSKRKLNLNWIDNDWNDNCRFLVVRKSFYSPLIIISEEFYFISCFRQPPSMRPISDSGLER